jgi:hypothetical protein
MYGDQSGPRPRNRQQDLIWDVAVTDHGDLPTTPPCARRRAAANPAGVGGGPDTPRSQPVVDLGFGTDRDYYWAHRADHTIRLLWTAHSVHHSSEYFNLTTALRLPWRLPVVDHLRDLAWVPAALIGIPTSLIFVFITLGLIYQFPLHTERIDRLPWVVEFFFNIPSHHRVHHGSDPEYLDKNFGGVFIIWDRMFGTFAKESHRVTYGLTKNINTCNPIAANYHVVAMVGDVRSARTWRGRLGYIFHRPGWREQPSSTDIGTSQLH